MTTKLAEAERLWRACFDDDEAFVRFYFGEIARAEEIYLHYEGGEAVAHIHAPHYRLEGGVGEAFYISGACTLGAWRGRGVMRTLMLRTLREEHARGCVAALLIPADEALRAYYARHFGFVTCGSRYETASLAVLQSLGGSPLYPIYKEDGTPDVLQMAAEALAAGYAPRGIRHSRRQAGLVIREYDRWGRILSAQDASRTPRCIALCREVHDTLYIDAVLGSEPDRLAAVMPQGAKICLALPAPPTGAVTYTTAPRAMVRPLNVLAYAQHYAASGGEAVRFAYQDPIIAQNTGTYTIEGGQARYEEGLHAQVLEPEALVRLLVGAYWVGLVHD